MRKNLLVILALLLGITALHAKPVDVGTAQRLGLNFIQHKAMFAKSDIYDLDLAYTYRADNGTATMYVFNFDGGFVIVAADDSSSPILGYSNQGNFDLDNAPDGLRFMLSEISRGITTVVEQGGTASGDIFCRWKNLETCGIMRPNRNFPVVGPLVQLKWDQGYPYNMYAPGGCPTGCVATAMAQLMKYWEWPVKGTGEHSYMAPVYGQQYANFGETSYEWDNMVENYSLGSPTQEQKEAVATLMYHCGVSVNMTYEPDGSGAFSVDVPSAINTYFSYSNQATHINKVGHTYDEWIALLKSNIDQQIPLYYSGQSPEGGHAFVCDGYDNDDLFYFNWGWGGAANGFFLIDGEHFDYSGSQAIVYDFIPDYVYDAMPKAPENLSVSIDNDISRIGHLTWTNPSENMMGEPLTALDKIIVKRNSIVVHEITGVEPGATMTYDDEVPYFDQFEYTILAVQGDNYGRTTSTKAVFGPYCDWKIAMTSTSMQGWDGGGITVQNAAGSYIDFLTFTPGTPIQTFQMALGNNNIYWVKPNSDITNISFKIRDAENQIVYQYEGPSSDLEEGLLRTLNNTCGNTNTCETPTNLRATIDPENDLNVILTWESNQTPEFGYCIYRDGFLFNMAHELIYVDESTNIGGHCYYVTSLCTGGETANSNEYCVTSGTGCNDPTDFYFEYASNNKPQLFWSAPQDFEPTGYVIYRKIEDGNYKELKRLKQTTFKDSSAQQGKVTQYKVVAYYQDIDCYSSYASSLFEPMQFFIIVDWSNTPKNLMAELLGEDENMSVSLRWTPAFNASSYTIMRNGENIGEVTETAFTDESLAFGETYCYTVIAHGDDFEETSNEACVTVPEAPEPPILPCSAPANLMGDFRPVLGYSNAIHVEWQVPEDRVPDSYTMFIYDMIGNETTILTNLTETVYESVYAIDGTDKIYQVKAVYPECESEFALTADGNDFVRLSSLSIDENVVVVKLYPNPASSQVTVEAENMISVSLYNLVGQCLMETTAKDGTAILDMNEMQNGIYLVKVNTKAGSVMQKVIKM